MCMPERGGQVGEREPAHFVDDHPRDHSEEGVRAGRPEERPEPVRKQGKGRPSVLAAAFRRSAHANAGSVEHHQEGGGTKENRHPDRDHPEWARWLLGVRMIGTRLIVGGRTSFRGEGIRCPCGRRGRGARGSGGGGLHVRSSKRAGNCFASASAIASEITPMCWRIACQVLASSLKSPEATWLICAT